MAVPLLAGVAKGLLSGAGKKAATGAAKKFVTGKKKRKTEGYKNKTTKGKAQDVGKKVNAKVKPTQKKVATVKLPNNVYKTQSGDTSQSSSDKKVSFESLGKQLDSINKTTSSLASLASAEKDAQKQKNKAVRSKARKDKLASKEEQLEKKKEGGGILGGIMSVGSKFGIFDFLKNVALGGLALLALNNIDTITNLLTTLTENFSNPFKFLKSVIVGISTVFAGPIKGAFNILWKGIKGSSNILKKGFKKITPAFKKLFGGIGRGLSNFAKGIVSKVAGLAGKGATKGVKAAATGTVASQKSRAASTITSKASNQAAKSGIAKNVLGKGGKRILKLGKIFKRVPVIGGMLGIVIDLLLGEPLDRAIVGAVGGGIGAWIGGGIGSLIFPFLGTAAGAVLGSMVGDWAGKALYEMLKKKMGLVPPVDPKDRGGTGTAGTGLTQQQFNQRSNIVVGQTYDVKGKNMVWNGLKFVTPQQYQQQTGNTPQPMSSPQSTGPSSRPSTPAVQGQQSGTPTQQQAFNQIYNIAKKVGGANYPEIVAAQAMHETGYLANPNSVFFATNKTNAFGQTISASEVGTNGIVDKYWYRNRWWAVYDSLESSVKHNIKLWHDGKKHKGNYNNFNSPLEGIASVAPAYSPNADPANIALGYTEDAYSKGMVKALKVGGFDAKGKAGQQSSQPTSPMQPASTAQQNMQGGPRAAQLAPQQRTIPAGQQTLVNKVPFEDFSRTAAEGGKGKVGVSSQYKTSSRPNHSGIDIGTQKQKGYYVALKADGKVTVNQYGSAAGNMLFIKVGNLEYVFMHLARKSNLKVGESYTAGTPIGEIGNTGRSFGEHLHFEVRPAGGGAGTGVDPNSYLNMLEIGKLGTSDGTETQQVEVPSQQAPNQAATVSSRTSYDPMSTQRGGGITPIPIPGQQQSGGGGGRAPMMGGPSTQQVLNSYYKSQLMGFLYKQG